VTINTSIPATATSSLERNRKGWITGEGLALSGLLLLAIPASWKRARSKWLCLMVVILIAVAGCGGSAKTTPVSTITNAPAGNYTATITAVGSGITHTLVVKVVVQ
jgi:hypothetical protein